MAARLTGLRLAGARSGSERWPVGAAAWGYCWTVTAAGQIDRPIPQNGPPLLSVSSSISTRWREEGVDMG